MTAIIKTICIVFVYYSIVSLCNTDKIIETAQDIRSQVKEYVVEKCPVISESGKVIAIFKASDIVNFLISQR